MVLRSYMRRGQPVASITSRQFNHDVGAAKRAAQVEPVVITDRGEPAYVLMTMAEYGRLRGEGRTIVDMIRMDTDLDIEFEVPERPMLDESRIPDFDD